jgi:hypothetical protein
MFPSLRNVGRVGQPLRIQPRQMGAGLLCLGSHVRPCRGTAEHIARRETRRVVEMARDPGVGRCDGARGVSSLTDGIG